MSIKTRYIWRMGYSGMLRSPALVRTDVSEERIASIRRYDPPKRRFLQEPHVVKFQKTGFFTVICVKTSNII
jgi:hypothetical protein